MRSTPVISFSAILLLTLCVNSAIAGVTANPIGISTYLEAEQLVETGITLTNDGDEAVPFRLSMNAVRREEEQQRRVGPRRDDPGEVLQEVELAHSGALGIGYDPEHQVMWVTHTIIGDDGQPADGMFTGYEWDGNELGEIVADFRAETFPLGGTYYDGVLYATSWQNAWIIRYSTEGENLGTINFNGQAPMGFAADPETGYLYVIEFTTVNVHVLDINDDFNRVGLLEGVLNQANNADFRGRMTWVPDHEEGHLWISFQFQAYQVNVDQENWEWEEVQHFDVQSDVRSYGIGHDGRNLWIGNSLSAIVSITDDGVIEPNWLVIEPEEGEIPANDEFDLEVNIIAEEGLEAGIYEELLTIHLDNAEPDRIEMSMVLVLETDVGSIVGTVTDAENDDPLSDVRVDNDYFVLTRFSDDEGGWAMQDLPLGAYNLTFSSPEYLPSVEEVLINEAAEFRIDVELLHGECDLSRDNIETALAPDASREFPITVSNEGNGLLTYTVEKRMPGGAEAAPWEQRFAFQAGEAVQDNRLNGVAFAEDHFFVSGTGTEQTMIYVLDREGALTDSFPQVGTSRNGMEGLAWDGDLLWGSGENRIFGFSTDGDSVTSFRGAQRTTRSITWDPVNEWLWTADATSDIIAVNRDGEEQETLRRQDQTIHGLAFYANDPDGYPLYVLSTLNDTLALRKMNLENDAPLLVAMLEPEGGGTLSSAFITSTFDPYSTVFISVVDAPEEAGGDRLDIWQVQGNNTWMRIDPVEGNISPEEAQDFTLTLDATDLAILDYEGQVVWMHDGFGREAIVDVLLHVTEQSNPPTAFNLLEPANGDTLPEGDADFIWQQSVDPDPDDEVAYRLWFKQGLDSVMTETADTSFTIPLEELGLADLDVHAPVEWWAVAVSGFDEVECIMRFGFYLPGAGVGDNPAQPAEFALYGAYPNPFNSLTRVSFSIPSVGQTFLSVFDVSGRKVDDLWAGQAEAGVHEVTFDAAGFASGVYVIQLESAGQTARMKVALVR